MIRSHRGTQLSKFVCGLVVAVGLSACAGDGGGSAGPYAKSLPYGTSCKSIRSELRRLDGRGVPAKVEAANAGKKLSADSRKLVNRYNQLLNDYLGARCHV